jgi:4-hydroxy-4-methyl-2-oxoglutarate aldolase
MKEHSMDHDTIIARLRRLDSCALSDAADKLGLPPAVSGLRPCSVVTRVCGRIVTVRLEPATAGITAKSHLCTAAIEAAAPGDVIVVAQRSGMDAAGWGGILSNAARRAGVSGVIVEGPARDVDEAREIGFPVYAREATARTARGRVAEAETGGQIMVGDVAVFNGDYVTIDSSGAVFIPAEQIAAILDTAEQISLRETVMTKAVLAGKPVGAVMGSDYETMLSEA